MPSISNTTISALYELCGADDYPVEEYCIGCVNCEGYGFPCLNCAVYVFNGHLGQGNDYPLPSQQVVKADCDISVEEINDQIPEPDPMDIDDPIPESDPMEIDEDIILVQNLPSTPPTRRLTQ